MASYPYRDALRDAHDIYLNAMRPFIVRNVLDVIQEEIEIRDIAHIIRTNWDDSFKQWFEDVDPYYEARSAVWQIVESRNRASHPPWDLDPEFTRTHLFLIANLLEKIDRPDAKRRVENIQDRLFPDNTARQTEEVEQAAYKKRLATMSTQLAIAVAGKTTAEEHFSDISNRLEAAEVRKTELEKRLKTMSDRLKDVERENAAYKKRIETIPDQLETANTEKVKYDKVLKAASNQLATLKTVNTQLEERLETTSTRLEEVEEELADCKERLVQFKRLPLNPNTPDSVTFQGTTFTKHLNEYHVEGDDISQSFWHYWQSQGREGKQEMRDAGWSVEKVDGDWEVTISPVDFQAWIENEVTELSSLINFSRDEESSTQSIRPSYEKISLPTVREMEQPALRVLADGKEHRRVEVIDYLTEHFSLTDNERSYLSKTGQSEKHLMSEGLIERTRTGYYRITARGRRKVRTL